ncbi:MAG TPA: NAD(P)-dependent oxidoreductase [bacterium]|nr:NAD(P)-dependent oxidoreductase [bacterium]HPN44902.1 NAD(P)-dependent oxidoreductase [bacterium]
MKVLVTGASGFLGSRLVEVLLQKKYQVKAMVRPKSNREFLDKMPVEVFVGDLGDKESLRGIMDGVDMVIHAGATTFGTFEEQKRGTIEGTKYMLDLAQQAGIKKFVHVSSLVVYDMNTIPNKSLINESFALERFPERAGGYAYTKTLSEQYVQEFMKTSTMPITIVRPGLVYGARRNMFFPHLGFSAAGGKVILRIGCEEKVLPLTYIYNTCEVMIRLLDNDKTNGKIYNIIDPKTITYKEYLQYYLRAVRLKSIVVPVPFSLLKLMGLCFEIANKVPGLKGKFGLTRYRLNTKFKNVRYDGSLLLKTLNWYPELSLDESLERAFHKDK